MRFKIADQEYVVKTRQAIEILDMVEKSGVLETLKNFTTDPAKFSAIDFAKLVPFSYRLSADVVAIATGVYENGKLIRNETLIDELDAIECPMLAVSIVKTLVLPISYVITDDTLTEEKKNTVNPETVSEVKSGKLESVTDQTVQSETSTTPSVTQDSKPE